MASTWHAALNSKPTYKRFDTHISPEFVEEGEQTANSVSVPVDVVDSKNKSPEEPDDVDDVDEDVEDPYGDDILHHIDPAAGDPLPTTCFGKFRHKLKKILEHLAFRIFGFILILIDISILIVELATSNEKSDGINPYEIVSLVFISYFVLEVSLRIVAQGPKKFFKTWFNVVDLLVIALAFIVTVIYATVDFIHIPGAFKLVVAGRLVRIVMFLRLFTERKHLEKGARHLVSQNKRRYQKDGFDLDLTYVTERVIAMSFPSAGKMSIYRNPIKEVARFLDTKHTDHYKVYNLCSERTYDDSHFHGRVERYLMDDHNVPLLHDMLRFASSVKKWLNEDEKNVIAVHCKGGKGRTGTMICVWLVESGLFGSAGDSLSYFGYRRTDLSVGSKFQGVETPSQSRYVGYYGKIKDELGGELPNEVKLKVSEIKLTALAGLGKGNGSDFSCEIFTGRNNKVFECHFGLNRNCQTTYFNEADYLQVKLTNCPSLSGDIKFKFQSSTRNIPRGYEKVPFYFWFHTSFIENNRFLIKRDDLDNPHKPKTWQWFREKFSVELIFIDPASEIDERRMSEAQAYL